MVRRSPLVTSGPFCFRARFVDVYAPSLEIFSIQGFDGELGFIINGHFNESESLGATRFTVADYVGAGNFTEGGKGFPKIFVRYGVG